MAKETALYINAKLGIVAAQSLDGSVPDFVRRDVYRQHKTNQFQFLCVCGLCREGYNDPGIGAVAVFRPTKSRSLSEQMKGRGCRPLKGTVDGIDTAAGRRAAIAASAKPDCLIVDLVGITGLADAAGTAEIYAQGLSDEEAPEVIRLANEKLLSGEMTDVMEAVKKSREEWAAELAERKRKREEDERKAREEFERRIRLGASTRYTAREVEQGAGGSVVNRNGKLVRMATQKQLALIRRRGVGFDDACMTFGVASRVIGQLMKGIPVDVIKRTNRLRKKPTVTEQMNGGGDGGVQSG
jgi:superfamily II DNA or RNA helicase